jgi:predicted Ser/Thr protein kinase
MDTPSRDWNDDRNFALLHAFLEDLQAGRPGGKEKVLLERPELAPILECLECLQPLAPPCASRDDHPQRDTQDGQLTLPFEERGEEAPTFHENFGNYHLEAELGRGGMGVVYRARQKDLRRCVALKMILGGPLASKEMIHRFQDEARAAACLNHPNIVAIYDAGQHNGQPYFAMQYIPGPSLAKALRQGAMSPETGARLVQTVARAVQHLHDNGIVHRDLKPSNILLDNQGQPYVTDFGLVKLLTGDSQRTSTGVIVGTPSYMAPEQASGRSRTVGPLSDIYSLGAILYEILTGKTPFQGETPLDTLVQVLESDPVAPRKVRPNIPVELEAICLRCLEKDPQQRYASADQLAQDLERFLKGEDVELRRISGGQRLWRWARREPGLASRLGMLLVCCIIAVLNYHVMHNVPFEVHWRVLCVLVTWGLASVVYQRLMAWEKWSEHARFLWLATDVILFTAILWIDRALNSPLVIGYPLIVAGAGLWFRARLVWATSIVAILAYLFLLLDWLGETQNLNGVHKHIIFLVGLVVLAFMLAFQVNRVRALSRYYENRPLP